MKSPNPIESTPGNSRRPPITRAPLSRSLTAPDRRVDVTDEPYFHQVEQRGFVVLATSVCVDPDDLPRDVLLIKNCRKDTAGSFRGEPHRGVG